MEICNNMFQNTNGKISVKNKNHLYIQVHRRHIKVIYQNVILLDILLTSLERLVGL